MAAVMAHDASAELHRIEAPTLVLKPAADMLIPPRCSDELAAAIAGAQLATFEHASHGFNVEQADKFNRAVLDFFAQHPLDDGRVFSPPPRLCDCPLPRRAAPRAAFFCAIAPSRTSGADADGDVASVSDASCRAPWSRRRFAQRLE